MSEQIRLLIVEDQEFMAKALASLLSQRSEFLIAGCAFDGNTGLKLCESTQPALVLVDIQMPNMNGFEFAKHLVVNFPTIRVLFMTGLVDPHTVYQVIQSKAHGCVSKMHGYELLMSAIEAVARGETYFCPSFHQVKNECLHQPESFLTPLSDRELEVLKCMASGLDDPTIGRNLKISPATVGEHRKNIRKKLRLHNDRELLAYAQQRGLRL